MTSNWNILEDGLQRAAPGGTSAKCISLATARKVAEGGAVVVEACPPQATAHDAGQARR